MVKLKPTQYLVLLISSLLLSIIYLNFIFKLETGKLEFEAFKTGAVSAIPAVASQDFVFITIATIVFVYVLWVWIESDKLKKKLK